MTEAKTPFRRAPRGEVYTAQELAYLLAGRTTEGARIARENLKLAEVAEGDPSIPAAVQSLAARGLIARSGDEVDISEQAKVLGYILGTSTDWTRLFIVAPQQSDVFFGVVSPEAPTALVLRVGELGTFEALAVPPGVPVGDLFGKTVQGYLQHFPEVAFEISRARATGTGRLRVEYLAQGDRWTIHELEGLEGLDDVTEPTESDEPRVSAAARVLLD